MQFVEYPEFTKEFKKLKKRYISLDNDLENLIDVIKKFPLGNGARHWNILKKGEGFSILKTRMRCLTLQSTELRMVYLFDEISKDFVLIEIYYKGDKENEDKARVENIFNSYR